MAGVAQEALHAVLAALLLVGEGADEAVGGVAQDDVAGLRGPVAALVVAEDLRGTRPLVGPDSKFAKISPRCSGARPLHAARKRNVGSRAGSHGRRELVDAADGHDLRLVDEEGREVRVERLRII